MYLSATSPLIVIPEKSWPVLRPTRKAKLRATISRQHAIVEGIEGVIA